MLWNNHFPVHSLNVNTKERAQTVPHHILIQIAERSKQQFKSNLLMSLGNRGTLPWTTGSHQYSQMQIQGTKLLYARLLCFVAEVSQQFRANASAPRLPTRKIFEAGDNTGTAEGRQQDTIVSICLDMNRAKQSATLYESVQVTRMGWQGCQCGSNMLKSHFKRLLSSFSCQCFVKRCSATIHVTRADYKTHWGSARNSGYKALDSKSSVHLLHRLTQT